MSRLVHRLNDLLVEEVSTVDRAANKRRFLVVKRAEGDTMMIGEQIHDLDDGTRTTKADPWGFDLNESGDKGASEDDAEEKAAKPDESEEKGSKAKDEDSEEKGSKAKDEDDAEKGAKGSKADEEDDAEKGAKADEEDEEQKGAEKQGGIPAAVKAGASKMLADAVAAMESLLGKVKGATEGDAGDTPVPAEVGAEMKRLVTVLRGIVTKYPAPSVKVSKAPKEEDEEKAEDSEDEEKASRKDEEKASRKVEDEDEEKAEKAALAGPVKAALVKVLEAGIAKLKAAAKELEGVPESEEEMPAPLPDSIARVVVACADALEGAMSKYPSPTAKADARTVTEEAIKLLQVALGKMQPGKALDEEAHRAVGKARELLTSAASPVKPEEGEEKARSTTTKAGAKQMSRDRRKRFKEALDVLSKLFAEIIPEAEKAQPPWRSKTTKADTTEADSLRAKLEKSEEKVRALRADLRAERERPVASNSAVVEKGAGAQVPGSKYYWPQDLNEDD